MFRFIGCLLICLALAPAPLYHPPTLSGPELTDTTLLGGTFRESPLPSDATLAQLAASDPVSFLKHCLARYDQQVTGYEGLLYKQERLEGTLYPPELVRVAFQGDPHRVRLRWIDGARKAGTVLYVKGENHDKVLILPAGWRSVVGIVDRDPYGDEARQNGRYPLPEFGIKFGMMRTLAAWMTAQERGNLHVQFVATRPVPELNDRVCYVLHRTQYEKPEDGGVADSIVYIDTETWLQTGSEIRDRNGNLLAKYYFKELHLNPRFAPETFTRQGMR
jgi:hypothetical protein